MSDSIEAVSPLEVSATSEAAIRAAAAQVLPLPSPANLVLLIQGLYGLFWGLMATAFGTAHLIMPLTRPLPGWVLLLGGSVSVLVGAIRLGRTRIYSPLLASQHRSWKQRTNAVVWLAILLLYFAVIFLMWREARPSLYLFANMLGFLLTFMAMLVALNFVVPPLAHVLSRRHLALEAQVFSATNIGLIMLPLLGTIGYVMVVSVSQSMKSADPINPLLLMQELVSGLVYRFSLFSLAVALLPFSLTLALLWTAKDSALRALADFSVARGDHPDNERDR